MVTHPFFVLKIGRLKVQSVTNTSIDMKTGSSDPADFGMIRLLIHWNIAL
jgi:hypothetical protein